MWRKTNAEIADCFCSRYRVPSSEAQLRVEQLVFGTDFGANGWTPVEQADELCQRLELGPGQRLLDLGTGRGWPGLYLVLKTRCDVVLTDPPVDGLRHSLTRAARDGIAEQVSAVAASVSGLPFRSDSFDAVVHTDVLCCLRPKLRALVESRRILRPAGRTAFFVIHVAPDLSGEERRRAIEVGPPAVASRGRDYPSLLRSAGFVDVERVDVTPTYRSTLEASLRHTRAMADELAATESPEIIADRIAEQTAVTAAIDDGLLRRSLLVARKRGGRTARR